MYQQTWWYRILLTGCFYLLAITAVAAAGDQSKNGRSPLNAESSTWKGDFDDMVDHHIIRFLVPFSKTFYFLDNGRQRGLTYEYIKLFEQFINKRLKKGHVKVKAIVIPTSRDRLLPDLAAGIGDVAAGNLTITRERLKVIDFTDPFTTDVKEVVVTGPASQPVKTLFDLAGREVFVRKSSSYYESLLHVNETFAATGKKPIKIIAADEYLEDEDLLEMVNAGLIPAIVIDKHKGDFWTQIFDNITLHDNLTVHSGGRIAWAIRKNSPQIKKEINAFVKGNKKGSLNFNMLFKRYLEDTKYIKNNLAEEEAEKFKAILDIFKKYGHEYDFDWIMLGALAYQESGLDQSKRSQAGAIGIMQVLPTTASDPNVAVKNIKELENNVHAGTKYLRFMTDRYYTDEAMDEMNRQLFAFASYNAGPARIARLRKEAGQQGFDPNVWFNNVEVIAAKRIGRETVQYVSNIYKYYIAYKMIVQNWTKKSVGALKIKKQYQN